MIEFLGDAVSMIVGVMAGVAIARVIQTWSAVKDIQADVKALRKLVERRTP